jgi:hypothetical protein
MTGSAVILPPSFSHRSSIFFFSRFLSMLSGIVVFLVSLQIVMMLARHPGSGAVLDVASIAPPVKTGDNSCNPRVKTLSLSGCMTNTIQKTCVKEN